MNDGMNNISSILEGLQDGRDFVKEIQNNPINKKIKQIANKYGYDSDYVSLSEYGKVRLDIYPKDRDFHPDVYIDASLNKGSSYKIQTSSFGALDIEEHQKYLKSCEDANKMVREIMKLDLSKLPLRREV